MSHMDAPELHGLLQSASLGLKFGRRAKKEQLHIDGRLYTSPIKSCHQYFAFYVPACRFLNDCAAFRALLKD